MEIHNGMFQLGMSQQDLNRAQVRTCLVQVGSPTVAQSVRRDVFGDAGSLGGFATGVPRDFVADGDVRAPVVYRTGEQVGLGLHPAPVFPQGFQQFGAERHVAIAVALACPNVNQLALAVDEIGRAHVWTPVTEICTLSLPDALPICQYSRRVSSSLGLSGTWRSRSPLPARM